VQQQRPAQPQEHRQQNPHPEEHPGPR
jgi:hypothetical protein